VALSGCEDALSAVHPAGPAAATISTLWWVMLAGAALIFVFVMALIAVAWRRPPGGQSGAGGKQGEVAPGAAPGSTEERRFVIGLGLAFPLVVLAALLGYGLIVGERLLPRAGPDVVTVRAEASRWQWRFAYADAPGRVTEQVLHIPAARPVDVEITTADVIHSFWVPRLAGKLDAVPGHVTVLRIEAFAPGTYEGLSSEFSGPGYAGHRFRVIAHGPEDWAAFLAEGQP